MNEEHPLARRLDDGRILVRHFGQEPDGTKTDGWVAIGPDDPAYASWEEEITNWEDRPEPPDDTSDYEPIDFEKFPIFRDAHPNGD